MLITVLNLIVKLIICEIKLLNKVLKSEKQLKVFIWSVSITSQQTDQIYWSWICRHKPDQMITGGDLIDSSVTWFYFNIRQKNCFWWKKLKTWQIKDSSSLKSFLLKCLNTKKMKRETQKQKPDFCFWKRKQTVKLIDSD